MGHHCMRHQKCNSIYKKKCWLVDEEVGWGQENGFWLVKKHINALGKNSVVIHQRVEWENRAPSWVREKREWQYIDQCDIDTGKRIVCHWQINSKVRVRTEKGEKTLLEKETETENSPLRCSMKQTLPWALKARVSGVIQRVWKSGEWAMLRKERTHSKHTAHTSCSDRQLSRRERMSARETFSCQHTYTHKLSCLNTLYLHYVLH